MDTRNADNVYTSCIRFNGRPILPPIITQSISKEMARFRQLAVDVEKRLMEDKKRKNEPTLTNHLNDHQPRIPIKDIVGVEMTSPPDVISTPPSVASTYLSKYMRAESVLDGHQQNQHRSTSESNTSTVVEDDVTFREQEIDVPERIRKLSYTLDQPSPMLVAQLQNLTVEDTLAAVELSPLYSENVDATNDYKTGGNGELDSEGSSYCTAGTSSYIETVINQKTRDDHLYRYLQQVNDLIVSDDHLNNEYHHADNSEKSLTENGNPENIYERMLVNQERHYEQLRVEMEEQYKKQLEQLTKQRNAKLDYIRSHLPSQEIDDDQSVNQFQIQESSKSTEMISIEKMKPKFDRVSAVVKGYLVRRLFRTEKVQNIIKTIKDTLEFALQFHSETPIKQGRVTPEDATLHQRILTQLSSACFEFYDIFIALPVKERMSIIAQDRAILQEKLNNKRDIISSNDKYVKIQDKPKLTSATLKTLERRRHRQIESRTSNMSSSPRFVHHFRSRIRSPRSGTSSKDCRKILTSAIDSEQARSTSYALIPSHNRRLETSMSENLDTKNHLRNVRRCLYGKAQTGSKARSKSTLPVKVHPTTHKKLN